jgi:hypothetical protein
VIPLRHEEKKSKLWTKGPHLPERFDLGMWGSNIICRFLKISRVPKKIKKCGIVCKDVFFYKILLFFLICNKKERVELPTLT